MSQLTRDNEGVTEYAYLHVLRGEVFPGIKWDKSDSLLGSVIALPNNVDQNYAYIENGVLVEDTTLRTAELWEMIRICRDRKLKDCDSAMKYMSWAESGTAWTQQHKDDWRNYRQALLDVPQDIQSDIDSSTIDSVLDINPDSYAWPTKPELP